MALARHMLHDTSPQLTDHHNMIKKLTGRKEVQLSGRGSLSILSSALERDVRTRSNRNSRKRAVYFANKIRLEKKCLRCGSLEELELDHIDENPRNNDISNLRWLCKPCHMAHHGFFHKREDYQCCSSCKKLRVCGTFNQVLLCSVCHFKRYGSNS